MNFNSAFFILPSAFGKWLPDMDLNHDKQIQSLLCYRYTIGQDGTSHSVKLLAGASSRPRRTGVAPVSNSKLINLRQARRLSYN